MPVVGIVVSDRRKIDALARRCSTHCSTPILPYRLSSPHSNVSVATPNSIKSFKGKGKMAGVVPALQWTGTLRDNSFFGGMAGNKVRQTPRNTE